MSIRLRFYSTTTEQEQRLTIPRDLYDELLNSGQICENKVLTISQYWLNVVEKPVRMRVRHSRDITNAFYTDTYEHTVKYPIGEGADLEVTSELSSRQYDLIKTLVNNKDRDKKIRKYLTISNSALNGDYTITADFKPEWPDHVFVEFEANKSNPIPFSLPECFKEGLNK